MFRLAFRKMWNKKWMNLCLLIGIILMVATLVSFPLYQDAAYDRMLQDEFNVTLEKDGNWPARNSLITYSKKDKKGTTIKKMEKFISELDDTLGVKGLNTIYYYSLTSSNMISEMQRPDIKDKTIRLAMLSDIENHVNITYGENLSESGIADNGAIEVLIDESCLLEKGLLIGETLTLENVGDTNGKPLNIYIKGVYNTSNNDDYYWQIDKLDLLNACFMKEDLFREKFLGDRIGKYSITCEYFYLFSYKDLSYEHVGDLLDTLKYMTEKSKYRSVFQEPVYREVLENYQNKQTRIRGTLMILQIPVLILVAAFLFMISGQMYEMEKNEISVIKSRGSYRRQIFSLYLIQNIVLVVMGGVIGILLGRAFASVLASTRNFLEFTTKNDINIRFTTQGIMYAGIGCLFSLSCLTIPAISHSRITIVNLKQSKATKKKPLWEKLFLDVVLLGVSLYAYYSFSSKMGDINSAVLSGQSLDPLLYISSSLFILGAGLLYLRLQPLLVHLIFLIGQRKWGPAGYVSFMENRKNGRKQQVIMLFLIMTISLGMYHAIVARTILDNALENREYLDGADVIIQEKWMPIKDENGMATGEYVEPGFQKYLTADFSECATRVFNDTEAYYSADSANRQIVTVMGIHTKEFGSMTSIPENLNEKSYYTYLNELAEEGDGILVSSNFKSAYGVNIGDTIYFHSSKGKEAKGKIVDFVDYWPGFSTTVTTLDAEGNAQTTEGFLIVAHFSSLYNKWTGFPYEVWVNMKDGYSSSDVYDFITEKRMSIKKYVNKADDIDAVLDDPLLQGTNGVLTLGFAVTILLCGIGYLIFWIMSVKERELVFGVLRAGGLHSSELITILLNEQLFCGMFSCVAGAGIGFLTSRLFVPILQNAYASADQTLPMRMIIQNEDMIRLGVVIFGVIIAAMMILVGLLKRMNVTKALKLGEE